MACYHFLPPEKRLMKAIVLHTMRATAKVLLGNSWKMVQSFCSKKLQRLILDDTLFCLIFVALATYNKIMIICYIPRLLLN